MVSAAVAVTTSATTHNLTEAVVVANVGRRHHDVQLVDLVELRSLGLNAEILDPNDEEIPLAEDDASGYLLPDLGGINLAGFED